MGELTTLIDTYLQEANAAVDKVAMPATEQELNDLASIVAGMANQAIAIGDSAFSEISSETNEDQLSTSLAWPILFQWIDDLKHYVLLWRDTLFEFQKGLVLFRDNRVVADDMGALHQ